MFNVSIQIKNDLKTCYGHGLKMQSWKSKCCRCNFAIISYFIILCSPPRNSSDTLLIRAEATRTAESILCSFSIKQL